MDRRWALAIISLIMMILVYGFLSMIFKADHKKVTHSRMYRDYSSYGKKRSSSSDDYSFDRRTYASSAEARKIKRTMLNDLFKVSGNSYNTYMAAAVKSNVAASIMPKNNGNPQYKKVMELARKPLPQYQSGLALFAEGDYEGAISMFDEALNSLDPMEMKNRMSILNLLAECYLKQKNDDGYIQNKIRLIRIERKYKKLLAETFPDMRDKYERMQSYMSTDDATKNLLRVKTAAASQDTPATREMLKRAELDLEIARKVTQ